MNQSFRLSVAEFAFAMAHSGNIEAAYGYLQTMLGIEPERFNDWMTAASHTLIARNLLEVHSDGSYGPLHADLHQVAQAVAQDQRTLRCHRIRRNVESYDEQFVTVLFAGDLVLAHWTEQNVVAMTQTLSGPSDAYEHIAAFIGLPASALHTDSAQEPQQLPADELSRLRKSSNEMSLEQLAQELRRFLSAPWIDTLANTLADPQAWWGDVLRIDRAAGNVVAEDGFLFVASSGTAWLLAQNPDNSATVRVVPAACSVLAEWCDRLAFPPSP